jgi:multidrug efflux system membrane fusion protein
MLQQITHKVPFLCILLLFAGCSSGGGSGPQGAGEVPKTEVVTDAVSQEDVQLYIYGDGMTRAYNSVDIRARVAGYLEKKLFSSGDLVKEGEQLAVIEQTQYEIALDGAKAELANNNARLDLAEANLKRTQVLHEQKAVSTEELQSQKAERDMAAATVEIAKNAVRSAELNLQYTDIRSPITGKAARWLLDEGNYVSPSGQSVLISVAQLDPIYVDFKLSDRQFLDLKDRIGFRQAFDAATGAENTTAPPVDQSVHPLTLTGGPIEVSMMTGVNVLDFDFTIKGKVIALIDNQIDSSTGQVTFRAQLNNPLLDISGSKEYMLYPDQICRIRIPYERVKGAVLIREEAVLTDLDTKYILLVKKGMYQPTDRFGAPLLGKGGKPVPGYETEMVERRDIKIGRLLDSQMRMVESGLNPGEQYIVKGVQRVRIGMEVQPITLAEYNKRRAEEAYGEAQTAPEKKDETKTKEKK